MYWPVCNLLGLALSRALSCQTVRSCLLTYAVHSDLRNVHQAIAECWPPITMLLQHQAPGCRLAIWRPHCFHNLSRPQACHGRASSTRSNAGQHLLTRNHRPRHDILSKRRQARCTKSSVGVTCQAEQPKATKLSMDVGGRQVG